jgi:phospholipid transport system substrate-binding protein
MLGDLFERSCGVCGGRHSAYFAASTLLLAALALLAWGRVTLAQIDPSELVKQTTNRLVAAAESQSNAVRSDPQRSHALVREIVLPHVDFDRMSRWVLGKYWRRANAAQREKFTGEFQQLVVRTYATAVNELEGVQVRYLPTRPGRDGEDAVVRTEIRPDDRPPFQIDYRVYRTGSGWKVYDISIEGVSLVASYRHTFRDQVRRGGIEGLIEELATRNRRAISG